MTFWSAAHRAGLFAPSPPTLGIILRSPFIYHHPQVFDRFFEILAILVPFRVNFSGPSFFRPLELWPRFSPAPGLACVVPHPFADFLQTLVGFFHKQQLITGGHDQRQVVGESHHRSAGSGQWWSQYRVLGKTGSTTSQATFEKYRNIFY